MFGCQACSVQLYISLFNNTLGCVQDTILVVPPYPYSIAEDTNDVPWEDMWYARAQLFFTCHMSPSGGRQPKNPSYKIGPDDLTVDATAMRKKFVREGHAKRSAETDWSQRADGASL